MKINRKKNRQTDKDNVKYYNRATREGETKKKEDPNAHTQTNKQNTMKKRSRERRINEDRKTTNM